MKGNVERFKKFLITLEPKEYDYFEALLAAVTAEVKKRSDGRGEAVCFGKESAMDLLVGFWRWEIGQPGSIRKFNVHIRALTHEKNQ